MTPDDIAALRRTAEGAAMAGEDHADALLVAVAEIERLRAVIEGRRAPPTDDELVAHRAAGGSWRIVTDSLLIGCADRQPDYNVRIIVDGLARLRRPVRVRWWALDAGHCVCPWPSVRATSD